MMDFEERLRDRAVKEFAAWYAKWRPSLFATAMDPKHFYELDDQVKVLIARVEEIGK